jgi:hypothetical protein
MNTPRKNRIALRPSVLDASLEGRLVMSHVASAFSFPSSFVAPNPMISVGPLTNVHIPVVMDYGMSFGRGFSGVVQTPHSQSVMGSGTPGHYNPFNPSDRTGFGPTHSQRLGG